MQFIYLGAMLRLKDLEVYKVAIKENKNFCYYSRGSAYETMAALSKAVNRKLISTGDYSTLKTKFERYFKLINPYIKSIGSTRITITSRP